MASIYNRNRTAAGKPARWYATFKDEDGRRVKRSTGTSNKVEARAIAHEWERRARRIRFGIDPPAPTVNWTVAQLMRWWLAERQSVKASFSRTRHAVERHIVPSQLGRTPLRTVRPAHIHNFLADRDKVLGAKTVNNLRGFVHAAFNCAIAVDLFVRANPVSVVPSRRVGRRHYDFLRPSEVPRLLRELRPFWRRFYATAIYTGMRKGELFALRRTDLDFELGLIAVCGSHERDTTKSGHHAVIPMADELRPFLKAAATASTSTLVFPRADGRQLPETFDVIKRLRRALGRAGLVLGYTHICRRKGCGYQELRDDSGQRRCPTCGMKLWAKARPRPLRFHDLRHTCASLLLMAGADLHAVSRILRHTDVRMTLHVYGHLVPGYLRDEVNKLRLLSPEEACELARLEDG